nr:hypothetical protein [Mesorhizobium sp.]
MAGIAIVASCGELSIIRALDLGEATALSPLQYTLMIWSTIWGLLVFAQLPDVWTFAGTAVIVVSGVYSIYYETRRRPAEAGPAVDPERP